MDWITSEVAIGNYLEANDLALLQQHSFRAVLSLDGTLRGQQAADFGLAEVASYRLIDGAGNDMRLVRLAVEDLCRMAQSLPPVLVQCHAGRSRSAAIVAAFLVRTQGLEPEEAIAVVASKREINITSELIQLLYKL